MDYIVADVGGTNTRFAHGRDGAIRGLVSMKNDDFDGFAECLRSYLEMESIAPAGLGLHLAVAAPIGEGIAHLTNRDWSIVTADLAHEFAFAQLVLVNDFAAQALALDQLVGADLVRIGGPARADGPRLVLGPGTGFGAALALADGTVLATEGGHALLPAADAREAALLARLREGGGALSIDSIVSGSGLPRLYAALTGSSESVLDAATIFTRALERGDAAASEAVAYFFRFAGSAARTLTLATGATGGVYLTGGILPRYAQALRDSSFYSCFCAAPAPAAYLQSIPCYLITRDNPALIGLAAISRGRDFKGSEFLKAPTR